MQEKFVTWKQVESESSGKLRGDILDLFLLPLSLVDGLTRYSSERVPFWTLLVLAVISAPVLGIWFRPEALIVISIVSIAVSRLLSWKFVKAFSLNTGVISTVTTTYLIAVWLIYGISSGGMSVIWGRFLGIVRTSLFR
ncbi:MAG TPA: hypothetical protein VN420_03610 [Candidatus Fimivivens sp.]|nr:hypothetical protein [Candidatus Fimivivens sp.]